MISRYLTLRNDSSYLLLGPRQTGKTCFVKNLSNNTWYINLLLTSEYLKYSRDPGLFRKEALFQLKQKKIKMIIIDEIQRLPNLLNEVHTIIEEIPKSIFIMTGSSARKLKRSSVNLLAGRAISKRMYPFIFSEIQNKSHNILDEILQFGTLPGVFEKEVSLKIEILRTYVETYLKEEIQLEGLTRNLPNFSHFLEIAAQSFAETLNYSKIGRACNQSPKTTQNYYDILEDTLIGFRLPCWNKSKRKQLASHPKFYFFDNGVTAALLSRLLDPLDPSLRGRMFEQWIINEIKARTDYDNRDVKLFVWKEQEGAEVDLLLARGKTPLFAAEIKSFSELNKDHFRGLEKLRESYPKIPLYLICTTSKPYSHDSINIFPWQDFLLDEINKY